MTQIGASSRLFSRSRLEAALASWAPRRFSARARLRIMLIYQDHQLARTQFEAFHHYRARFAARGVQFRAAPYADALADRRIPEADAYFVQSPYTPPPGELETVLARLRHKSPSSRISYFDWFAPTDIRLAERVNAWADFYVKKSLLRDRDAYLAPPAGHTNLTDYYAARYGTDNPPATWRIPPDILPKLVVGPAFSTGRALIGLLEGRCPDLDGPRPIDLHARIATKGSAWYSLMRQQAADAVSRLDGLEVASKGMVSKQDYMAELGRSRLVFSPFGYGEICWRDFEAIAMGAVLIKPDMGHIDAAPDIYVPNESYIPVQWDFSDLEDQVRSILADPGRQRRMAERAFAIAHDHLRDSSLETLVERLTGRAVPEAQ